MMMGKLFNSTFENSLRILLLMEEFGKKQNLDMLYVADFMVSYGATFGFSKADLNGDNPYKFSEFASRREIVRLALKQLVLDGLVYPSNTDTGILYSLTELGHNLSLTLDSDYATEYRTTAKQVVVAVDGKSERVLIKKINKMSAASLVKGSKV